MIETKRLRIYPATQSQMETFIDEQNDDVLKMAYSEMLEGCLKNPDKWEWYAIWMIELKDGTKFDHSDMLADVDAVNINAHIKGNNGLFSANIKGYYNNTYDGTKVKTRYTSFLQNQFGTSDKESIRTYIDQYFFEDSTGYILNGVNTPFKDYKKPIHLVTDAEKRALRDGFLNYIYNVNSGR